MPSIQRSQTRSNLTNLRTVHLVARVYSPGHNKSRPYRIESQVFRTHHYARVENLFRRQGVVHSCFVYVHTLGTVYKFALFCTNKHTLPANDSVPRRPRGSAPWRGNILVVRCGKKPGTFVNLRAQDDYITDQIIRRFGAIASQGRPFKFPSQDQLSFVI